MMCSIFLLHTFTHTYAHPEDLGFRMLVRLFKDMWLFNLLGQINGAIHMKYACNIADWINAFPHLGHKLIWLILTNSYKCFHTYAFPQVFYWSCMHELLYDDWLVIHVFDGQVQCGSLFRILDKRRQGYIHECDDRIHFQHVYMNKMSSTSIDGVPGTLFGNACDDAPNYRWYMSSSASNRLGLWPSSGSANRCASRPQPFATFQSIQKVYSLWKYAVKNSSSMKSMLHKHAWDAWTSQFCQPICAGYYTSTAASKPLA